MMKFLMNIFVLAALLPGVSLAQDPLPDDETASPPKAARVLYLENCAASAQDKDQADRKRACTCEADYLNTNLSEQQFQISAALVRFGDNEEAITEWVLSQLRSETYTAEMLLNTANRLTELAPKLGAACGGLDF